MIQRLLAASLMLILVVTACRPNIAAPTATITSLITEGVTKPEDKQLSSTPTVSFPPISPTTTSITATANPTPTALPVTAPTVPTTPTPTAPARQSQAIIIDHTSIELFDQIPEGYLSKARELKMMFADASVGRNINDALNCLTAPNWSASPASCRKDYIDENWNWKTFSRADFEAGRVPARILFSPDPVKYDRSNWIFEPLSGDWSNMTQKFIETLAPAYLNSANILSYQFNYSHVTEVGNIADPEKGFFVDDPHRYDYKDLEKFIAQHPDKTFFFWTTSLARSIGTEVSVDFNDQMRRYVLDNDLILFDVADIESHTDKAVACYDSRDGVEYCSHRADGTTIACGNEPDDGLQIPAICQDYTTEVDGGHLGSVSAGGIRLAKAFWVLMARIAGWQP